MHTLEHEHSHMESDEAGPSIGAARFLVKKRQTAVALVVHRWTTEQNQISKLAAYVPFIKVMSCEPSLHKTNLFYEDRSSWNCHFLVFISFLSPTPSIIPFNSSHSSTMLTFMCIHFERMFCRVTIIKVHEKKTETIEYYSKYWST
ncbi:hypothetical protein RDWZM_001344 [Blomia tropicalis]|uniref:Uncharacterized protein n=1 Tax=Blomia tropicalis TaxID=40697 RepID=A0A9Q0MCA3_BLOTA|nr:hypothetical protein RDWZM_001344 [Blomia tropicalis]